MLSASRRSPAGTTSPSSMSPPSKVRMPALRASPDPPAISALLAASNRSCFGPARSSRTGSTISRPSASFVCAAFERVPEVVVRRRQRSQEPVVVAQVEAVERAVDDVHLLQGDVEELHSPSRLFSGLEALVDPPGGVGPAEPSSAVAAVRRRRPST